MSPSLLKQFKDITGFSLFPRQTNYLSDQVERRDSLCFHLCILFFSDRKRFESLREKMSAFLKEDQSETIFALAGYVCYIGEEYGKARQYFLKAISLNHDNFDNWIDLAFTLRHLADYEVSNGILFHHDYVLHYHKLFGLAGMGYSKLKMLIELINKKAASLKQGYRK